jgi:hypothetical protein
VGGCIADLEDGRTAIIEDLRMPKGVDLRSYPHFNTNTLWMTTRALEDPIELDWFAARKKIRWSDGSQREVVQFEQLIGQASERVPTKCVAVPRARFLPIKTVSDLEHAGPRLRDIARDSGIAT